MMAKRKDSPPTSPKTAKKPKFDSPAPDENETITRRNSTGEGYVDLGKKKRATVRNYKGHIIIDIREYYGPDNDEKPGKKGITLSPEQWEALKLGGDDIDILIAEAKKK